MAGSSSKQKSSFEEEDGKNYLGHPLLKPNQAPRKKLLILCLGGLLCHRVCRKDNSNIPIYRSPDTAYGSIKVYKRPYCEDFMRFCLERFEVGVWSSAREWYLNSALDCVMGGLKSKLLFAWDQNQCTDSGFSTLEKKEKPIFLKDLKKVWERNHSNLLWHKEQYSSSNTLLIDDEPYKALLNPPHTAIFSEEYKAYHDDDTGLGPNSELRRFLTGLANADDVPSYVKEHTFGQPAITPSHSDWNYYSKIILSIRGG